MLTVFSFDEWGIFLSYSALNKRISSKWFLDSPGDAFSPVNLAITSFLLCACRSVVEEFARRQGHSP